MMDSNKEEQPELYTRRERHSQAGKKQLRTRQRLQLLENSGLKKLSGFEQE